MKRKIFYLSLIIFLGMSTQAYSQDNLLNSIIKIVSPVEVADLIKELNIPYNKSMLNNSNRNYDSDFKNALNLGVYSTDLGYANINEQSSDALTYLSTVKRTANKIGVGDFIDMNKILMIATQKGNLNLLLEVTSETFERMSDDLQSKGRGDLAALILAGGFLETFYITAEVANANPNNAELQDRLVQQKIVLEQIVQVLDQYSSSSSDIRALNTDLKKLNGFMSKFKFGNAGEVVTSEENVGGVVVVDVSAKSTTGDISVSREDMMTIKGILSEIRGAITR